MQTSATIVGCIISGNIAYEDGGGIYTEYDSVVINSVVINNESHHECGGISGEYGNVDIYDSTIVSNSPWGIFQCSSITNSIIWGNDQQISGDTLVIYSDIQGGWEGEGNIEADPLFVQGPLGEFYLSHVTAGQSEDSPCIDAGSDLAENICFQAPDGEICMNELTTRTDHILDSGMVDMGFHYPPCVNDGDVNGDSSLTMGDVQLAFYFAIGMYEPDFNEECAADCNGNGEITVGDAQGIFLAVLGMGACADPL